MRRYKQILKTVVCFIVALSTVFVLPTQVFAVCGTGAQSCSTNYRVDQTVFSSGGELNACSTGAVGYCSQQTAGDLTVGNTKGTLYQAYAGFNTTDDPYIEFVVTGTNIDLGYLDPAHVSTATGTFYVRAWQASGYSVRTESDPPTNTGPSAYHITPLATPTASSAGTEQFGINLVKNTNFCGVGCNLPGSDDPQPVLNGGPSLGQVATGYDVVNQFKYVKDDVVALSTQSTSVTVYTVSYIFNISNTTPSGGYMFNHVLVATGTY